MGDVEYIIKWEYNGPELTFDDLCEMFMSNFGWYCKYKYNFNNKNEFYNEKKNYKDMTEILFKMNKTFISDDDDIETIVDTVDIVDTADIVEMANVTDIDVDTAEIAEADIAEADIAEADVTDVDTSNTDYVMV